VDWAGARGGVSAEADLGVADLAAEKAVEMVLEGSEVVDLATPLAA
tara:strand:- start:27 stop:164 length:138 start_codon:yes stop_codon:yes gene_type:complete